MALQCIVAKALRLQPNSFWRCQTVATRAWKPSDYDVETLKYNKRNVPKENKSLPHMQRVPKIVPKQKMRQSYLTRGVCRAEDGRLKLKQYGVIALKGGLLKFVHFNNMQINVNRFMKNKELFAIWRVQSPYHAVTKHPLQAVMGGGKGKVDYYVTPVKARQVIFEVGGKMEFSSVYPMLKHLAGGLPFPAMAVEYEMLQAMYEEERRIEDENENFFTFREVLTKNMGGLRTYLSPKQFGNFGKFR